MKIVKNFGQKGGPTPSHGVFDPGHESKHANASFDRQYHLGNAL